jgi:hypothetical protein
MDYRSGPQYSDDDISEDELMDGLPVDGPQLVPYSDDSDSSTDNSSTDYSSANDNSEDEDPEEPPFPGDDEYIPPFEAPEMEFPEDAPGYIPPASPEPLPDWEEAAQWIQYEPVHSDEEDDGEDAYLAEIRAYEEAEDANPESDVEQPPTPEPEKIPMEVETWRQWGWTPDIEAGTMVYVKISPAKRCSWKVRSEPYFLGPVMLLDQDPNGNYLLSLPVGFVEKVGNTAPRSWVQIARPDDESRIVDPEGNLDFTNRFVYIERPFMIEDRQLQNPWERNSWSYKTYWRCFGCIETTRERESHLRLDYPRLFQ